MASAGEIEVRIIGGHALLKQEIAILRLLKAIADQERDDAKADAAAYRHERDTANAANRALRVKADEDATLLRAARCVGRDQEREIQHLHAHIAALSADEFDVVTREQDLISRIDTYQCETEGLKAQLAEYRNAGIDADALHALAARIRHNLDPRTNA